MVDFTSSSPQVQGSINSIRAVTLACVYYAFKAVCDPDVPSNEGAFRPIEVITPHGSIVHPKFPAAVNSANANTAQRVVDLLQELQRKFGLTYIFVAHGLNVVKHISDE